jgi:hypothetical protein
MSVARVKASALFEGEWKDGRPWRGSGRFLAKDGRCDFDGYFRRGAPFQGSGKWCDAKGNSFCGTISDAWPLSGEGVSRFSAPPALSSALGLPVNRVSHARCAVCTGHRMPGQRLRWRVGQRHGAGYHRA